MSGGTQRTLIARALQQSQNYYCDEPTANIDPKQKLTYDFLQKLSEKMAIILVTHDTGAISFMLRQYAALTKHYIITEKVFPRFI